MLPILVSIPLDNHGKHNLLIKDERCHCDMTHWLVNPIVKLKMFPSAISLQADVMSTAQT